MIIHIINELSCESIRLTMRHESYTLKRGEHLDIETAVNYNQIYISAFEKSNHYFDLPALLTLSFGRKSSWCEICCASVLKFRIINDSCSVTLRDNTYQSDSRHNYKTVLFKTEGVQIVQTKYILTGTDSVKRKHALYNILVPMLTPLLIANIVLFCIFNNIGLLLAALFCFFVFTVPGLVDIVKFNKKCDDKKMLKALL